MKEKQDKMEEGKCSSMNGDLENENLLEKG